MARRWGLLAVALLALPLLLAVPSAAGTYQVPCTGNPDADGQALVGLIDSTALPAANDTITLATPCTFNLPQQVVLANRTLRLLTDGGRAVLQGTGTQLITVNADARLDGDKLDLVLGEDRVAQGGGGLAGNLVVSGTVLLTDTVLRSGQGDAAGNLSVGPAGHATLLRSALVGGTSPQVTEALVQGYLSLIDSTVFSQLTAGVAAVRFTGTAPQGEITHNTFLVQGTGTALEATAGYAAIRGNVVTGSATGCAGLGQGLVLVPPNLADDASCTGATVADPLPKGIVVNPTEVPYVRWRAGSAVLDAGDATTCGNVQASQGWYSGPTDVRGRPRSFGGACDLGAVEANAQLSSPVLPAFTAGATVQDVVVTATGADDVDLAPPVLTGSPAFALEPGGSCGDVLPAGTSCTYRVRWTPQDAASEAFLSSVDNAGGTFRPRLFAAAKAAPTPVPVPVPTAAPTPRPTSAPTARPTPVPPAPTRSAAPRRTAAPSVRPSTSGTPVLPRTDPTVAAPVLEPVSDGDSATWRARHADPDIPWFVRHLRTPDEVDTSLSTLTRSALLALLLVALLGVPVNVASGTIEDHREQLAAMLQPLRARLPRFPQERFSQGTLLLGVALMSALVDTFLDPGAGLDQLTTVSFAAALTTVLVTTVLSRVSDEAWLLGRFGVTGRTQVYPGFWLLALTCVVASRALGLSPGVLLGSLAGVEVARSFTAAEKGHKVLYRLAVRSVVALYAWSLYGPLAHEAQRTHAFAVEVLASVTSALFLSLLGGTLLGLLPLATLDGLTLLRWSPVAWASTTFVAAFGFVHVLLHKDTDDPLLDHPGYLLVLLLAYGAGCLAVVAFWRAYDRRAGRPAAGGAAPQGDARVQRAGAPPRG